MVRKSGGTHATSYWQVGNSAKQNGMFKMKLGEAKRKIVSFKLDRGMSISLGTENIVPFINATWEESEK